jgi:hypothetical protein
MQNTKLFNVKAYLKQLVSLSNVAGESHLSDGGHPQGESSSPRNRSFDDQQVNHPAVQDHRTGKPGKARFVFMSRNLNIFWQQ